MLLAKIFRENTPKQLMVLALEQWIQPFIAWIPGITGFTIRYVFFKLLLIIWEGSLILLPASPCKEVTVFVLGNVSP